jgi:hypothetical protein
VFCGGTSTADPAADADAPSAIAKDSPAIPNAGAIVVRLFRFELVLARAIGILHTLAYVALSRRMPHRSSQKN